MLQSQDSPLAKGTVIQIASYNTNLQGDYASSWLVCNSKYPLPGDLGVPQDLVDWLSPTLKVSNFLTRAPNAPDIVAVGFQELLPLHLGCMLSNLAICDSPVSLILFPWSLWFV